MADERSIGFKRPMNDIKPANNVKDQRVQHLQRYHRFYHLAIIRAIFHRCSTPKSYRIRTIAIQIIDSQTIPKCFIPFDRATKSFPAINVLRLLQTSCLGAL